MTTTDAAATAADRSCVCGHARDLHEDGRCNGEHPRFGSSSCPDPYCPCIGYLPLTPAPAPSASPSTDPWAVPGEHTMPF